MYLSEMSCWMNILYFMHLELLVHLSVLCGAHAAHPPSSSPRPGGAHVLHHTRPSERGKIPQWDPNGYIFFCLCMGRTGNQLEHLLGGMAFAKAINRSLVIPPFRTYRNVRFTEWFEYEPMEDFHRVVLAEDFMEYLAPEHWPIGKRTAFCYKQPNYEDKSCNMDKGVPFGQFWGGLGVKFDEDYPHHLSYNDVDRWNEVFPPSEFPVLALRGAPAPFPMKPEHWALQRHLVFSEYIQHEAEDYINRNFPNKTYLAIHLRNDVDWKNACDNAEGKDKYMASPQCLHNTRSVLTANMCYPSHSEIIRLVKNTVIKTRVHVLLVATDKRPMIDELTAALAKQKVSVFHADPYLPVIDWALLVRADHFIGNCVSSFTSFVRRARDVEGKTTLYWGLS